MLAGLAVILTILAFVAPIVILILVVLAIVNRDKSKGNADEEFETKIRAIYLYLILIVSLIMIITGVILTIAGVADLAFPTDYSYVSREDNDILKQRYNAEKTRQIINSVGLIAVTGPIFIIHKKKVEELRNKGE